MPNLLALAPVVPGTAPLRPALEHALEQDFVETIATLQPDLTRVEADRAAALAPDALPAHIAAYLSHLAALRLRFPPDLALFGWDGGASSLWDYEEAYTWRHLATAQAAQAVASQRTLVDGLRASSSLFLRAAGSLQQAGSGVPGTEGLAALMLAQAQECAWQKAVADGMAPTVVARLAQAVADLYGAARGTPYAAHVQLKQAHFVAAACFRMATAAGAAGEYGTEVAWLQQALRHTHHPTDGVPPAVVDDYAGLRAAVEQLLRAALRDNDMVYFRPVPSTLPPIAAAVVVKPVVEAVEPSGVFALLTPYSVLQAARALREREDRLVAASLVEPLQRLNRALEQFLHDRNLPAALDAMQDIEVVPEHLQQLARQCVARGGPQGAVAALQALAAKATAAQTAMTKARARVPPSLELEEMAAYLRQAAAGDSTIHERFAQVAPALKVLAGGETALRSAIPGAASHSAQQQQAAITLRGEVLAAQRLVEERLRWIETVEAKSRSDSVYAAVMAAHARGESEFEAVYEQHVRRFDEDTARVQATTDAQAQLEKAIDVAMVRFHALGEPDPQRTLALQSFENAYRRLVEVHENIVEGGQFYDGFVARLNKMGEGAEGA